MYLVFSATANDPKMTGMKGVKEFKNLQSALGFAYRRNQTISTQALGIEYLVFDQINKQVFKSERV